MCVYLIWWRIQQGILIVLNNSREYVWTLGTDQLTHIRGESSTSGGHGLFNKFRIQAELKSVTQLAESTFYTWPLKMQIFTLLFTVKVSKNIADILQPRMVSQ